MQRQVRTMRTYILYSCIYILTSFSAHQISSLATLIRYLRWCKTQPWEYVCEEGSMSQDTSIKKSNIMPFNDIWRCWEVSETTFMDTMPAWIHVTVHQDAPGWGQDRTVRSKITHYRRINECWGQQEERWRAAHSFEMHQQP